MSTEPQLTKGERTRKAILEAAQNLFLARGYTATSMRQIAQTVGITPAAIYNHFASKEEIFTALLREVAPYDQLFELFDRLEADTPAELLEQMFRGILNLLSTHEDYIRLALIDAQERDGATLVTFLPQLFLRFLELAQRLAALDAGRGQLRDIPPFLLARTMISLIAGYLMTERTGRPIETLSLPDMDWEKGLVDIFLYGVLKSSRPGS